MESYNCYGSRSGFFALDRAQDGSLKQVGDHRHADADEPALYAVEKGLSADFHGGRIVDHVDIIDQNPGGFKTAWIDTVPSTRQRCAA